MPVRRYIIIAFAILLVGCSGDGAPSCTNTELGAVVLTASGTFDAVTDTLPSGEFGGDCLSGECSVLDVGEAFTDCGSDHYMKVAGKVPMDPEWEGIGPSNFEISVVIPTSVADAGTHDFLGEGGNDGGVWISPGGPNYTGADDGAITDELSIDAISTGVSASGTFSGRWSDDTADITVSGTFEILCFATEDTGS